MSHVRVCAIAVAELTLMVASRCVAQEPVAVARPTTSAPEAKAVVPSTAQPPKIKVQPLSVTVILTDQGTRFTGTLGGFDQWPMKTSFGETNVPLSAVAGIKFAEEGNPSTTVVLHNGDSVSGALDINRVQIETAWGQAEIDSGHINSMLFSPGLVWTKDSSLSGSRWKLVAEKENRPAVAAAPSVVGNNRPSTAQPGTTQPNTTQPNTQPQPAPSAQPASPFSPFGAAPFGQPGQPINRPVVVGR